MGKQREPAITFIIRGAQVLLIIKVPGPNVRRRPRLKGNARASSVSVDDIPFAP